jgi:hypothetical protein
MGGGSDPPSRKFTPLWGGGGLTPLAESSPLYGGGSDPPSRKFTPLGGGGVLQAISSRLKLSRAARLSREGSGYLGRFRLSRAVSSYLEPPGYLERVQVVSGASGYLEPSQVISSRQVISSGSRLSLEHLRLSRGRLELSRAARLSREGSGYLGRSGYLEGSVGKTRASRWLARPAQDDSVRSG